MAYTSPNKNNKLDQSSISADLPPASNPTNVPIRNGLGMKKEQSEVDHLTKLLMKSMNPSNQSNFFG